MDTNICRFCNIEKGHADNIYDHPIKESENYYSLASVGTFIMGWSLIVPKKHAYSMRDEYDDPNFLKFANAWIGHVKSVFREKIIIFEHGANHCGSQTSCGTNHGHLHVVPYRESLVSKMLQDREWSCVKYDKVKSVVGEDEYLLYADVADTIEDAKLYIHILKKEESQYFRRLLAEEVGVDDYSYKTSPHNKETVESYSMLRGTGNG